MPLGPDTPNESATIRLSPDEIVAFSVNRVIRELQDGSVLLTESGDVNTAGGFDAVDKLNLRDGRGAFGRFLSPAWLELSHLVGLE